MNPYNLEGRIKLTSPTYDCFKHSPKQTACSASVVEILLKDKQWKNT